MKYKRYKRMKKAILAGAGTGIVAGMLLMGSATAFAESSDYDTAAYTQNTTVTGMHMMHRWNSTTKINSLANNLGLDPTQVKQELNSGKNLKQILQDNGIVPGQIQQAIKTKKTSKTWKN